MLQADLQNNIDNIADWANKNEITQNNSKTKITSYMMRNNSIHCMGRSHQNFQSSDI